MYPIQIVIIRELPQTAEYAPLRLLTKNPEAADIRAFLKMAADNRYDRDYQRLAHTVANVAYQADTALFRQIAKENKAMTGTIIDIVEDLVQEREKKAADEARSQMEEVITLKDSQLQQKDSEIQKKDTQLQQKDTELQQKDTEIRQLKEKLQDNGKELSTLKGQVNALMEELKKIKAAVF